MTSKNPISIEVLETLDAIDRRGSFAKASEELNKATSAVSYAVQKLEEQLDIALFQRQGRRSVLTPAGQLILQDGRKILQAASRLADSAKEVATGWEPRIRIAAESTLDSPLFFEVLADFLTEHQNVEIDVMESVLNGGWEALDQGRIELVVGVPGPVPLQKGFRAIAMPKNELVLVISSSHRLIGLTQDSKALATALPKMRRVVTHDTSMHEISRNAGLSNVDIRNSGLAFYVQNLDQKIEAIKAGIGIGHVPRKRIQQYLERGELKELTPASIADHEYFMAWKISNKGKALNALVQLLRDAEWK